MEAMQGMQGIEGRILIKDGRKKEERRKESWKEGRIAAKASDGQRNLLPRVGVH